MSKESIEFEDKENDDVDQLSQVLDEKERAEKENKRIDDEY
jgi:hypothetical protein